MKDLPLISRLRRVVAAILFGAIGVASGAAHAVSFPVFWDREDFGFGAGFGVSQATAQSANSAGFAIVQSPRLTRWDPDTLVVNHDEIESSLVVPAPVGSAPATITSNWSATNQTGINDGAN